MATARELFSEATVLYWDKKIYVGGELGWLRAPDPELGESVSMSGFSRLDYPTDQTAYVTVPVTSWGDYGGSDIERSNCRSLLRDYPESFVHATGGYGSEALYLPADEEVEPALADTLIYLRDCYPLYDEEDHSALTEDLVQEAWDAYAAREFRLALCEALAPGVDHYDVETTMLDSITDDGLYQMLWDAYSLTGEYPYAESAVDVALHLERVADVAADELVREWTLIPECEGQEALF